MKWSGFLCRSLQRDRGSPQPWRSNIGRLVLNNRSGLGLGLGGIAYRCRCTRGLARWRRIIEIESAHAAFELQFRMPVCTFIVLVVCMQPWRTSETAGAVCACWPKPAPELQQHMQDHCKQRRPAHVLNAKNRLSAYNIATIEARAPRRYACRYVRAWPGVWVYSRCRHHRRLLFLV